jgi:hypothetical protein
MKTKLYLLALLFFTSCNLSSNYEKLKMIEKDLSSTFNHKNINVGLMWGTVKEDNNLAITFYNYTLQSKSEKELEDIAFKVANRILTQNPILKKRLEFIEVVFTKEDFNENGADSSISFKIKKENF